MFHSVSVVIPTYNRASMISRAIDSVLAQRFIDLNYKLELIVIDDGSDDNTRELITEKYPQVIYCRQDNQGVSAARNLGLRKARMQWIALLDSDDEWLPDKLQSQFECLDESRLKVCHTNEIWVRDGVRVNQMRKHAKTGGWIFQYCLPLCAMSPSSILLHRDIFDEVGGFNEALPACEDYDMWLRIAARYEVAYIDKPLIYKYGGHDDQLSKQYWGMDRFRVIALDAILSTDLEKKDRQAAINMLVKKLKILLLGAHKHKNSELIDYCERKLSQWQDEPDLD